jgi:hypothetical protein
LGKNPPTRVLVLTGLSQVRDNQCRAIAIAIGSKGCGGPAAYLLGIIAKSRATARIA